MVVDEFCQNTREMDVKMVRITLGDASPDVGVCKADRTSCLMFLKARNTDGETNLRNKADRLHLILHTHVRCMKLYTISGETHKRLDGVAARQTRGVDSKRADWPKEVGFTMVSD